MTQKDFASNLLQIVDNSREFDNKTDEEIIKELVSFMNVLQPKDRENFSKWGFPKERSTPEDCWK